MSKPSQASLVSETEKELSICAVRSAGSAGSQAGRTASCVKHWKSITKDKFLLGLVRGIKLNFQSLPWKMNPLSPIAMSEYEMSLVDEEVQGMVRKGATVRVGPTRGQFLSSIFLIPKKSGGMRPVINLKNIKIGFLSRLILRWNTS